MSELFTRFLNRSHEPVLAVLPATRADNADVKLNVNSIARYDYNTRIDTNNVWQYESLKWLDCGKTGERDSVTNNLLTIRTTKINN